MRSCDFLAISTLLPISIALASCSTSSSPDPGPGGPTNCGQPAKIFSSGSNTPLEHRAYIVSRDSSDLTVIDLDRLEVLGTMNTCGSGDHMAELNADFSKVYVDSPGTHESIVIDARTLAIKKRISLGAETTHLSLSKDGKLLGIVNEYDNSVSFVDTTTDTEVKRLDGFYLPHFVRWAPDGKYAYVANLRAHHITRIDVAKLAIDSEIPLDGFGVPPQTPLLAEETGFADAQIDKDGILHAAHADTGRVLIYDTKAQKKMPDLKVGPQPWIVYAEHPFTTIQRHVVPNFGDQTVSFISTEPSTISGSAGGADKESFGVNYSPLVPDRAFVMNRFKNEIAVVDTKNGQSLGKIPVGGNTETASTTADGKYIVATVSNANRVVVIDAVTQSVIRTFDNVGKYPWSVTIPLGQNYCH